MPNEHQRSSKIQPKTKNSKKLATPGTQTPDEDKQNKNTTQQIYLQRNDTWNMFCYFFSFICLLVGLFGFFFKIRIMSICTVEKL
jgi:hypothetical protein